MSFYGIGLVAIFCFKQSHYCKLVCLELALKVRFHYKHGMQYSVFVLLIFLLLSPFKVLSEAKKSIKETKNTPFYTCSGNEPITI